MNDPLQTLLSALDNVSKNGSGWQASCPAHDDSSPSLSISEGDRQPVVMHCHAGCSTDDILSAVGLSMRDVCESDARNWNPWQDGEEVAVYPYTDAEGTTLFEVVRFEPKKGHPLHERDKTFLQRVPGKGWGRSKYDVDPVLYRLPSVLDYAERGFSVFIVEGEKDVHTLEDHGFVATTCPQGADKWTDAFSTALKDAHVVILPDNDEPGRKHARAVASSVESHAASVQIVDLSEHADHAGKGFDVSDWFERGGTADDLHRIIENAEEWTPDAPKEVPHTGGDTAPTAAPQHPSGPEHVFWYVDSKKGRVRIDRAALLDLLAADGFAKAYLESDLESTFIRLQDNIVEPTSSERMKDHVLEYVGGLPPEAAPENYTLADIRGALLRGSRIYFSSSLLETLPPLTLPFKRDTKEKAFFYFENGFVKVDADGFELRDYADLDGVIWQDQITQRTFTDRKGDGAVSTSDWAQFLRNVTGGDAHRHEALCSAIGYLLHGYKDPTSAKAVVLMDEKNADVPEGRTGKSIIGKAIGHLTPRLRLDARNFSFESRFRFQDVTLGTRVVDFNDASKGFEFGRLFSVVTDSWTVERKGQMRHEIPFADGPKIMISTNYVLEGEGASFTDRVFQIEFAPHYTPDRKPTDEFGTMFFEEWDADAWAAFDNIMLACVRTYLRDGLKEYTRVNVNERRLKQNTCKDFAEWALDFLETGRRYSKDGLWNTFKNEYEPDYDDLTRRKFGRWLASFARIYGYDLKKGRHRKGGSRVHYVEFVA